MKTRWTVRAGDIVSKNIITIGGIGTIVSVLLVFVFLSFETAPLFLTPKTDAAVENEIDSWHRTDDKQVPVHLAVDEHRAMGFALYSDGTLTVFCYDNGELLGTRRLFEGKRLTAFSDTVGQNNVAMGFDDGTVITGEMGFLTGNDAYKKKLQVLSMVDELQLPEDESKAIWDHIESLAIGESATFGKGVIQRTPNGEFRIQQVRIGLGKPVQLSSQPIRLIDHVSPGETARLGAKELVLATLAGQDELKYSKLEENVNQFTGEGEISADSLAIEFEPRANALPLRLMLPLLGKDNLYVVWTTAAFGLQLNDTNQRRVSESTSRKTLSTWLMAIWFDTIIFTMHKDGGSQPMPRPTVLIVARSGPLQAALVESLQQAGCKVAAAPSGELSIRRAADFLPDVVLLQQPLPDGDSIDICRRIRDSLASKSSRERSTFISKPYGTDWKATRQ